MAGEVDLATAPLLEAQFVNLVKRKRTEVVIDATKVTFMDSSGLSALLKGQRLIHTEGSGIYLVPSPQVSRLLDLVSSEPLLMGRFETVEEAIAALERKHD